MNGAAEPPLGWGQAPMAEKVLLYYDNRVDAGTVTASSEAGELVAANLQSYRLGKPARFNGFVGEWWRTAFAAKEAIDTVVLWAHNLSITATIRVRIGDDPTFTATAFDETFEAWPPVYGLDDVGLGLDGLGGYPVDLDTAFQAHKSYSILRLGETVEGLHLAVDIDDPDNAAGYVQAGRLIAGVGARPDRNFSYGNTIGWRDLSKQERMADGGIWVTVRQNYRSITLTFKYATEADAMILFYDMARIVGHRRDMLVLPFPDAANQYRTAIYGMPPENGLTDIKQDRLGQYTFTLTLEELI